MYCVNCGSPVPEGSTVCAQCGRRLPSEFYPAAPTRILIPAGTSSRLSPSVGRALGRFVGWFIHASRTTQILLVLLGIFLTGVVVKRFSTQESSSPEQQQKASSAVQQQTNSPAPKATYPPE